MIVKEPEIHYWGLGEGQFSFLEGFKRKFAFYVSKLTLSKLQCLDAFSHLMGEESPRSKGESRW